MPLGITGKVKDKQLRPGFELGTPGSFFKSINITPQKKQNKNMKRQRMSKRKAISEIEKG